ncbi:MFS general substrate transporter [Saccharata proteae CBS 121410]|uniref:MFS general substrate transporter n=1 Tax=Saccharata proteae CBS 121410 TaxID=1314787 RepID=A0A9P4LTV7_9PEZI|nr:MFS general substrate transporter [Saccharata proteae CBS 121410]
MTACGLNFAFGVYQDLYSNPSPSAGGPFSSLPQTQFPSPALIDLIGTLQVSLMTLLAPLASHLTRTHGPRTVSAVGGVIFLLANILASCSVQLWHFLLSQGLLLGVATCLAYIPAVTVAPGHFDQRRALAMGVVLAGTGVGGIIWAPTLRALNDALGFRNTLRITGCVGGALIIAASWSLRWDNASLQRNRQLAMAEGSRGRGRRIGIPLVNWRIARSKLFVAQAMGAILQASAYYAPIYLFSAYARTLGYSTTTGANFIAISNAASVVGKIALGHLADKLGRINTLLAGTLISSVAALGLWLPSTDAGAGKTGKALFVAFTVVYGVFAGSYVSLFPPSLVELFGVQNFASVNGFLYMLRGMGTLVGTPLAGYLIRGKMSGSVVSYAAGDYRGSSLMVGSLLAAATVAVACVRVAAGSAWQWKA